MARKEITPELIETFLSGHDPQERIVHLEYEYQDDFMKVFYRNENDQKCMSVQAFFPFVWAKLGACLRLFDGDRDLLKREMALNGIKVKSLDITQEDGTECKEMLDGYRYMFYATKPMSYSAFLDFFKKAGCPIFGKNKDKVSKKDDKLYLAVTPQEQFLISTGKRFFKGYEDYNELLRMIFDLETEGLDPKKDRIKLNGIRFNRPVIVNGTEYKSFDRIFEIKGTTKEEKDKSELKIIETMIRIIYTFRPDIITAHNGENFDWNFIIERCIVLGTTIEDLSKKYFNGKFIFKNKKESILKLGGEMETFKQTVVPGTIITDSLHAVRRAQALDSNMLEANLKYVTKYSELNKKNRVYIPGDMIDTILSDNEERYAFNDENGDWYIYDPTYVQAGNIGEKSENKKFVLVTKNIIEEGYTLVSGHYIAERYLLDDLWECDVVEHRYNTSNFLICKMLPVPFQKCCTMGTAGQWKALLLAWSYENNLAIPPFGESKSFTGGLSRLLSVGFVDNVAKFDYNSLYPSIILTWGIKDNKDLMGAMLAFLEHVLTQREKYKDLKKAASKKADAIKDRLKAHDYVTKEEGKELNQEMLKWKSEEAFNDKKQLPLKILGNSFFGSYGAPNVFPFGSIPCAERTTCTGRQSLRLMIKRFTDLGYKPIVGDSFTGDTPLFIKYKHNNYIDIKPIEMLINEDSINVDLLGREYDYSNKNYFVLCRSGWVSPEYIYRHKCDKPIYEVSEGDMRVEVTEDHSLFNNKQEKIKPSEIDESTNLEYYTNTIDDTCHKEHYLIARNTKFYGKKVARQDKGYELIPTFVYNEGRDTMKEFYDSFMDNFDENITYSKSVIAGLQYIKKMLNN